MKNSVNTEVDSHLFDIFYDPCDNHLTESEITMPDFERFLPNTFVRADDFDMIISSGDADVETSNQTNESDEAINIDADGVSR